MRVLLKSITLFSFLLVVGPKALAQDAGVSTKTLPDAREATRSEWKPSLAVFGGMSDTESTGRAGVAYGIEYGMQPTIPFSSAIELSGNSSNSNAENPAITRTRLMIKGNYNFGGTLPVIRYSYFGVGIGAVMDNSANRVTTDLGVAPQLGFDVPLPDTRMSLGANTNYLFVGGGKADVFALNGVAKYWF